MKNKLMKNIPFNIWPSMAPALSEDAAYLVVNHERAVTGRKPSGRPVIVWPNGKCRIEFMGTYDSIHLARMAVETAITQRLLREMVEL